MNETETKTTTKDLRGAGGEAVAKEAALTLFRKKGIGIRLFRVEDTTVIADYYVICTGRASSHILALADEVTYHMGECGVPHYRTEGRDGGEWLLVDFGDVLVHIFSRDAREYYNLERLLNPGGEIALGDLFEEELHKREAGGQKDEI